MGVGTGVGGTDVAVGLATAAADDFAGIVVGLAAGVGGTVVGRTTTVGGSVGSTPLAAYGVGAGADVTWLSGDDDAVGTASWSAEA